MDRDGAEGNGKAISFLLATLKGISQVVFIENWLTGLFILAAITVTSVKLGVIAILSAAIGTFVRTDGWWESGECETRGVWIQSHVDRDGASFIS